MPCSNVSSESSRPLIARLPSRPPTTARTPRDWIAIRRAISYVTVTPRMPIMALASETGYWPGRLIHLRVVSSARRAKTGGAFNCLSVRASVARSARRISRGAMLNDTSSRLSTSGMPVASIIRPRGAGRRSRRVCCRAAISVHLRPLSSCTSAAFTRMASANSAMPHSTSVNRSRRPRSRSRSDTRHLRHLQVDDLRVGWHAHAQRRLHQWREPIAARG